MNIKTQEFHNLSEYSSNFSVGRKGSTASQNNDLFAHICKIMSLLLGEKGTVNIVMRIDNLSY